MSLKDTMLSVWETVPVTIASAASVSDAANLGGLRLFGVVMPAAWTAANLTFQMSPDAGVNWYDVKDASGNEISAVAATSTCIIVTPSHFSSLQYLRVRSGTSATPVAQAEARSLQLILRAV